MSTHEEKVKEQLERLTTCSYEDIETAMLEKRTAWARQHALEANASDPPSPRQAFEHLFFEYMGLSPTDLVVIAESEARITWLSKNPCPTLDACLRLDLDTRVVCKAISERPTQAFLSQINPRLRFIRDYREMRPYAEHCLESIVRIEE